MPARPPKPCNEYGCGTLTRERYCATHKRTRIQLNKPRKTARWLKARKRFLFQYPLCKHCEANGITEAAIEVDHIRPYRDESDSFWDTSNWQGLCKRCHSRKTVTMDGGFI